MLDPDLWHPFRGGEKPMDFAYLNAVTRSTTMPPYDPWFAGGYLNYYYFGQFMTATLIKLTGILPEISLQPGGAPLLRHDRGRRLLRLSTTWRRRRGRRIRWRPGFKRIGRAGPLLAGLLGSGAGGGGGQPARRLPDGEPLLEGERLARRRTASSSLSGFVGMLGGIWKVIFGGAVKLPPFDYWAPSRMMPPQSSITEFPFFTFLFADLHAHLMAIPFDVAILGVGLALVLPEAEGEPRIRAAAAGRRAGWALWCWGCSSAPCGRSTPGTTRRSCSWGWRSIFIGEWADGRAPELAGGRAGGREGGGPDGAVGRLLPALLGRTTTSSTRASTPRGDDALPPVPGALRHPAVRRRTLVAVLAWRAFGAAGRGR